MSPFVFTSFKAVCCAVAIVCGGVEARAQAALPVATSWEIAAEFNLTVNSAQSLWQYGWKPAPLGAFGRFTLPIPNAQPLKGWQLFAGQGAIPRVAQNQKRLPYAPDPYTNMPAHGLALHPGSGGQVATIRFTAPSPANYRVSGQFYAGHQSPWGGTHTIASLVKSAANGSSPTSLWSGNVGVTTTPQANFTSTYVMLNTGEHLDFDVGPGAGNNYAYGSTGVHAVIQVAGCYIPPGGDPCD